jgi:class 3 adenylate cyclase/tetratricopeptide (TPR) repeat protein
MQVCPSCGQENPEIAKFCLACATPLHAEPAREERKVVTVLFADLVGFTSRAERMDPEDVRALLAPYHQRLRSELERFGGTVEKFIGDAVVALFGAPVAHEDDPERAVRAALAIRDWVREEEENLQLRIAVNTGEALIALGARPEAGEGMASGDVVNTTARLQSAAPVNGILVGETTWRATRDRIEYVEREAVSAKGKTGAIAVWEPVQARSRVGMDLEQHSLTPLVGREHELTLLFDAFDRVCREREPQLLTVVGAPGIGKSRLVAELFQRIERSPEIVWWRQGRALPYGAGISLWALVEMVKAQAGIHENDNEDEAARKLRHSVAQTLDEHEGDWVLHQLEPLIGLGEDGGIDRTEAFAAWRRYLEGLAEQHPLVLVFEDLHWADDGLLDFVDHLTDWASGVPIFVVGTARPELLDRQPNWGGGKLNASTLALSALDDADAARVIGAVLNRQLLPAELQGTLLERAGGNPLYAEQFARLFLEHGSVDALALPENVQGIIAARLDALPEDEKRVLQDAAVLGKVFWSGGVASLTGFAGDKLSDSLHGLVRKGFVRRERRSAVAGEDEFAFRHVLVREAGYGQVPRPVRAEKHVAAAEWVESLGRADDHAELIAHHYSTALELSQAVGLDTRDLAERARVALRNAGDRAAALSSWGVAAGFYESALDLWSEETADRALVLFALGRAEYLNGDHSAGRLGEAVEALLSVSMPEAAGEAEAIVAEAAWYRGDREELDRRLGHALALIEPLPPSRAKAVILSQVSRYAMVDQESAKAIEYGLRALELAETLNLPDVRVSALNNIGAARSYQGDSGFEELSASVALAEEINSPELARSLNNLAAITVVEGDVRGCLELEQRSIVVAERFGLETMMTFTRANVLSSQFELGLWDELLAGAEEILAESPVRGTEAMVRNARGLVRLARDDITGALEDSEFALDVARRAADPQTLRPALAVHAHSLDAAGERDEARRLLVEFSDELEGWKRRGGRFLSPLPFVDGWIRYLGRDRARDGLTGWRRETRWLVAARAFLDEDFDCAAKVYDEMGCVPDAALVHLRAAEKLVEAGQRVRADAHLNEALSFYRSVGAARFIREAERLRLGSRDAGREDRAADAGAERAAGG